jgi:hypothetical protein
MTLFSLIEIEQSLSSKFDKKVDLVPRRDLKPVIGKKFSLRFDMSEKIYTDYVSDIRRSIELITEFTSG